MRQDVRDIRIPLAGLGDALAIGPLSSRAKIPPCIPEFLLNDAPPLPPPPRAPPLPLPPPFTIVVDLFHSTLTSDANLSFSLRLKAQHFPGAAPLRSRDPVLAPEARSILSA